MNKPNIPVCLRCPGRRLKILQQNSAGRLQLPTTPSLSDRQRLSYSEEKNMFSVKAALSFSAEVALVQEKTVW